MYSHERKEKDEREQFHGAAHQRREIRRMRRRGRRAQRRRGVHPGRRVHRRHQGGEDHGGLRPEIQVGT